MSDNNVRSEPKLKKPDADDFIELKERTAATVEPSSTAASGPRNRQSFQMRALVNKTLAYQKRQLFVNFCCVLLCPIAMIAIATIMGVVISALIANSVVAKGTHTHTHKSQ